MIRSEFIRYTRLAHFDYQLYHSQNMWQIDAQFLQTNILDHALSSSRLYVSFANFQPRSNFLIPGSVHMVRNTGCSFAMMYKQKYTQQVMTEQIEPHLLSRFKVIKKLGSGAYGHVFRVQDKQDGRTKALKKNFDAFTNSTDAQRVYREIMFLFQLKHPNIIHLEETIKAKNGKDIYLLFEHMDADLYEVSRAKNILSDKHRKYILYQIAKALYYVHSAGLMHRDLKPSNILINEECEAKLCDFGLVRSVDEDQTLQEQMMTEYIATRWYRAPQIILGSRHYSKAIDVWSFGCLIYQTFTGKALFPGNSTLNQIERVLMWTGVPSLNDLQSLKTNFGKQLLDLISTIKPMNKKQLTAHIDPVCLDLLEKTLQFNVDKRITIQEVLQHTFFAEFYKQSEIVVCSKKIKVPVKDNTKLTLKQYRSLIYEQISKHNLRVQDFSISKVRTRSLKSQQSQEKQKKNEAIIKGSSKRILRSSSHETQNCSTAEDIKTIKKTDVLKKRSYFDEWQRPVSRGPSAQKKLKQRQQFRQKNPYYKPIKGHPVKFRKWTTDTNANPAKTLASTKNCAYK